MATVAEVCDLIVSIYSEDVHNWPHVHLAAPDGRPILAVGIGTSKDWHEGNWDILNSEQQQIVQNWLTERADELEDGWRRIKQGYYPRAVPPPENRDGKHQEHINSKVCTPPHPEPDEG